METCIDWFGDGSLVVVDLSLACCAVESEFAVPEGAPRLSAVPEGAQVVAVISGTIAAPVADLVRTRIDSLGERTHVVAFGACACAGGPYWDSSAIVPGTGRLTHVDHLIPGCPPPPSALAEHVERLRDGGGEVT
ncbi:NADH-quinone oxidoreductase subunit B family protein [Aestuariimicrobium ganziense]|uniref:NADH-quinone oxidoreductase subunit B family protein n=1 Tax=Aestuariimicrobium ganziense TaxID=2773677 RepID=UPI002E285F09|nr:proton-conducting membrane transporter [Aestuariimicrobium ganziense]